MFEILSAILFINESHVSENVKHLLKDTKIQKVILTEVESRSLLLKNRNS